VFARVEDDGQRSCPSIIDVSFLIVICWGVDVAVYLIARTGAKLQNERVVDLQKRLLVGWTSSRQAPNSFRDLDAEWLGHEAA